MINCLSFSPLSFHSVFQLSLFIFSFSSILYPLITIFFLNFPFLSSLPDLPSASSYSCPCPASLITLFFSASFRPTLHLSLLSASFVISDLTVVTSLPHLLFSLRLPSPTFYRSRVHLGCLISSMLCNLRYVFEPASPLFFMSCVIFPPVDSFSPFFNTFHTLFYTTFLPVISVCKHVSVFTLNAHLSLLIPKQSYSSL